MASSPCQISVVYDRHVANGVHYRLEHTGANGTGDLLAFLEIVFGDNSVLRKDRKRLLAVIKDGSCSTADCCFQDYLA
jgi:hypothetical protein